MPRVFSAQYDGSTCGICGDPIYIDDDVTYVDDELCHAECAKQEDETLYD